MALNIFNYENNYNVTLCKISKEPIALILEENIESINRYIDDIDTIEINVPKTIVDRFSFRSIDNLVYKEIKDERLLCLNNDEYFVIKSSKSSDNDIYKKIVAYSLEYKLKRIEIDIEDISFQLIESNLDKKIYSLNDYLYEETGWKLGHIDDSVRYDISGNGTKIDKLRIQTNVTKSWYDFLKDDICIQFGCILEFDTLNKVVNLYDVETKGEDIMLYLTKDNYISELEKVEESNDIVTRMVVKGNDEMNIVSATPTGYKFIENYSYFIENGEMTKELALALEKYYKMIEIRTPIWKKLISEKTLKISILTDKQIELYQVYSKINVYKREIKVYEENKDEEHRLESEVNLTEYNDRKTVLEVEIRRLQTEIDALTSSIDEINKLCKYPTSTDEKGNLIFNQNLLNELKDYIYQDTYTNDSFLKVEDLLKAANRELSLKCRATTSYSIKLIDFTKRLISNSFRPQFKGQIDLGNIVILIDPETKKQVHQFIVGYKITPNDKNGFSIEISDKKVRTDYTRTISDYLNEAKRANKSLNEKKYILNQVKYNTINL